MILRSWRAACLKGRYIAGHPPDKTFLHALTAHSANLSYSTSINSNDAAPISGAPEASQPPSDSPSLGKPWTANPEFQTYHSPLVDRVRESERKPFEKPYRKLDKAVFRRIRLDQTTRQSARSRVWRGRISVGRRPVLIRARARSRHGNISRRGTAHKRLGRLQRRSIARRRSKHDYISRPGSVHKRFYRSRRSAIAKDHTQFSFKDFKPHARPRQSFRASLRERVSASVWQWHPDAKHVYNEITAEWLNKKVHTPSRLLAFQKFQGEALVKDQIYRSWMQKSWRGKVVWWRHALLYSLLYSPFEASKIILDISRRNYLQVPNNILNDALILVSVSFVLNNYFTNYTSIATQTLVQEFLDNICKYTFYQTRKAGRVKIPWPIVKNLTRSVLDTQGLLHFKTALIANQCFDLDNQIDVMYGLLQNNCLDEILTILHTFSPADFTNIRLFPFCTSLLRHPWDVEDIHALRRNLTLWLLKNGLQPDMIIRSIIIENYLDAGDWQRAWQMLELIRERNLVISEFTYAIFLRHFIKLCNDMDKVTTLYRWAEEDGALSGPPRLAGEFIQVAVSAYSARHKIIFPALLDFYKKHFRLSDLVEFGILEDEIMTLATTERKPTTFAVAWMIIGWIHDNKDDPSKLAAAYNNYLYWARTDHQRLAWLGEAPHLATCFLMAFGQHKSSLHMCIKVLDNMMNPPLPIKDEVQHAHLPDYEQFLEPPEPEDVPTRAAPLWIIPPRVKEKGEIPEYESFLEEPEEEKSSLEADDVKKWTNRVVKDLKKKPYANKVAPPTHITWSALLSSLLKHREFGAAEDVFRTMRTSGIHVQEMTWEIMMRFTDVGTRSAISNDSWESSKETLMSDAADWAAGSSSESVIGKVGTRKRGWRR